jgi:hypothetical protein
MENMSKNNCRKGNECTDCHSIPERLYHPNRYKKDKCKPGKKCLGKACAFLHKDEARVKDTDRVLEHSTEMEGIDLFAKTKTPHEPYEIKGNGKSKHQSQQSLWRPLELPGSIHDTTPSTSSQVSAPENDQLNLHFPHYPPYSDTKKKSSAAVSSFEETKLTHTNVFTDYQNAVDRVSEDFKHGYPVSKIDEEEIYNHCDDDSLLHSFNLREFVLKIIDSREGSIYTTFNPLQHNSSILQERDFQSLTEEVKQSFHESNIDSQHCYTLTDSKSLKRKKFKKFLYQVQEGIMNIVRRTTKKLRKRYSLPPRSKSF